MRTTEEEMKSLLRMIKGVDEKFAQLMQNECEVVNLAVGPTNASLSFREIFFRLTTTVIATAGAAFTMLTAFQPMKKETVAMQRAQGTPLKPASTPTVASWELIQPTQPLASIWL